MSQLADFRPGVKPEKKGRVWAPPILSDFPLGEVIAADQSLGAFGLLVLVRDERGLHVGPVLTLKGVADDPDARGFEHNLQQASDLRRKLRCFFDNHGWQDTPFVHEGMAQGGGRVRSPESSLLAADAFRAVMEEYHGVLRPMIQPQSWKRLLFGNEHASADKPTIRKMILPLAESLQIEGLEKITNEPLRDALGVGLGDLLRRTG